MPVLFVLKTEHRYGNNKAYLNTGDLSAFPEEEEYLVGGYGWEVKKIEKEENLWYGGIPFKGTVIHLGFW